jgi:nitrite reductase/ring-hydroxylating ferredoxin subunit
MEWVSIEISKLSIADVQQISVKGKKLTLVRQHKNFYVFTNKCPHAGSDITNGWCENGYLVCPVHRYKYNLLNGRGVSGQGDYLKTYPVKVEGNNLFIGFINPWFKFW